MCLIITLFAAVITTGLWYFVLPQREYMLGQLALMYWGASLMWFIDGVFCIKAGEAFLDLSMNDLLLGIVIVLCGIITWIIRVLYKDPKKLLLRSKNK